MQPQGASPTNIAYFSSLIAQFDAIDSATPCSEVQALVNETFASLQAYSDAINAQLAEVAPILALLSAPGDPTAVVTWVGNFITHFLEPYVKPYTTYALQLTQLATQVASLSSAITSAASRIPSCSITIPPII